MWGQIHHKQSMQSALERKANSATPMMVPVESKSREFLVPTANISTITPNTTGCSPGISSIGNLSKISSRDVARALCQIPFVQNVPETNVNPQTDSTLNVENFTIPVCVETLPTNPCDKPYIQSSCQKDPTVIRVSFCDAVDECLETVPPTEINDSTCETVTGYLVTQLTAENPIYPGEIRNLPRNEWEKCVQKTVVDTFCANATTVDAIDCNTEHVLFCTDPMLTDASHTLGPIAKIAPSKFVCDVLQCVGPIVDDTYLTFGCRPYTNGDPVPEILCGCDQQTKALVNFTNGGRSLDTDDNQPFTNVPTGIVSNEKLYFQGMLTPNEQPIGDARTVTFQLMATCSITKLSTVFPIRARLDERIWYISPIPKNLNDGSSWDNATNNLELIVNTVSRPGDQVWIQEGTYKPLTLLATPFVTTDEAAFLFLSEGVSLYGGFVGNEQSLSERNWRTHKTILDGAGISIPPPSNKITVYGVHIVDNKNDRFNTVIDGIVFQNWYSNSIQVLGNGYAFQQGQVFTIKNNNLFKFEFTFGPPVTMGNVTVLIDATMSAIEIRNKMQMVIFTFLGGNVSVVSKGDSILCMESLDVNSSTFVDISNVPALRYVSCQIYDPNSRYVEGVALHIPSTISYKMLIRHCVFTDNLVAMENNGSSLVNIQDSIFTKSSLAGLHCISVTACNTMVERCNFVKNNSQPENVYGSVFVEGEGDIVVGFLHCNFEENSNSVNSTRGGVVSIGVKVTCTFTKCIFKKNCCSFAKSGGVIAFLLLQSEDDRSNLTFSQCLAYQNVGGSGGVLYASGNVNVFIENCTWTQNAAGYYIGSDEKQIQGGGSIYAAVFNAIPSIEIINSILWNNLAEVSSELFVSVFEPSSSDSGKIFVIESMDGSVVDSNFLTGVNGEQRKIVGLGLIPSENILLVLATEFISKEAYLIEFNVTTKIKVSDRKINGFGSENPLLDMAVQPFTDQIFLVNHPDASTTKIFVLNRNTLIATQVGVYILEQDENVTEACIGFDWCTGNLLLLISLGNKFILSQWSINMNDQTATEILEQRSSIIDAFGTDDVGLTSTISNPLSLFISNYPKSFFRMKFPPSATNTNYEFLKYDTTLQYDDLVNIVTRNEFAGDGVLNGITYNTSTNIITGLTNKQEPWFAFNSVEKFALTFSSPAVDCAVKNLYGTNTDLKGNVRNVQLKNNSLIPLDLGPFELCPTDCPSWSVVDIELNYQCGYEIDSNFVKPFGFLLSFNLQSSEYGPFLFEESSTNVLFIIYPGIVNFAFSKPNANTGSSLTFIILPQFKGGCLSQHFIAQYPLVLMCT